MVKKARQAKENLESLAEHLRRGWQKLHPVTDQQLEKVRDAVRKQWDEEKLTKKEGAKGSNRKNAKDRGYDYFY
jgi:hypothetical protein